MQQIYFPRNKFLYLLHTMLTLKPLKVFHKIFILVHICTKGASQEEKQIFYL